MTTPPVGERGSFNPFCGPETPLRPRETDHKTGMTVSSSVLVRREVLIRMLAVEEQPAKSMYCYSEKEYQTGGRESGRQRDQRGDGGCGDQGSPHAVERTKHGS